MPCCKFILFQKCLQVKNALAYCNEPTSQVTTDKGRILTLEWSTERCLPCLVGNVEVFVSEKRSSLLQQRVKEAPKKFPSLVLFKMGFVH